MNLHSYQLQICIGHTVFLCFYDEPGTGKATSDLYTGLFNSQEVITPHITMFVVFSSTVWNNRWGIDFRKYKKASLSKLDKHEVPDRSDENQKTRMSAQQLMHPKTYLFYLPDRSAVIDLIMYSFQQSHDLSYFSCDRWPLMSLLWR